MSDLINKIDALYTLTNLPLDLDAKTVQKCIEAVSNIPNVETPLIIFCKDCTKHNKSIDDVLKENACPLISWRGKAQGHEFDYQYCVYCERKINEQFN